RRLFSGVVRDVTERKQAEDALRQSEARFRGAIESLHEGFALYDAEGRLVICNAVYGELHSGIEELLVPGARFEDLLNASVERGLLAGAAGREEEFIRERLEQHRNPKGSFERELTDGRWFIVTEGRTPDGGTYASLRDITALKQREAALRESEERFRAVVNHSPAKIHIKDALGRYTLINREAEKLFGVTDEEGRGKTSHEIFPKEVADSFAGHDQAVLETGQTVEGEEEWQCEDGLRTYLTIKFPIRDAAGDIVAVGAIGTDITESKKAEERIRHLATHDVLTDLPNRALGMDRLSQALALARRNVTMAALVFVDLDGFKEINDTHGHEAGDRVLKEVAGRLSASVRETDTVARFGGDEFLLVLTAMTDKASVTAVVKKVLKSVSRSFAVDGRVTPLGASIGIALYPGDGETPEELLRRADRAMYAAKAAGKNTYRFAKHERAATAAKA
ncbi:MAG: diguanylate cyclase, partial [Proteobacteria bacterium]|nr:diguanylate cyclase [Pseudomonadota bacterium]